MTEIEIHKYEIRWTRRSIKTDKDENNKREKSGRPKSINTERWDCIT